MKLLYKSLFLALPIFSTVILSTVIHSKESIKRIEMKCYVSMIGGADLIHYIVLNSEEAAKNLKQSLPGQKILTTESNKKQQIYKVKECVSSSNKFANAIAKYLDKNTAR
ncbi:MAG: hypothetical protein HRT37_00870 [Alteromonadaceae bacterium]|nr:hypothetical protein [Alteromonadaceae bacterium]